MLVLAVLTTQAQVARAGDDEQVRAGARATATEGAKAMQEGRWADAVALFKRAESLVHAPPHLLYMARAYVKLGKLVEAGEAYRAITKETLAPNAPRAFVEAREAANTEASALTPRIPSLTIALEGSAPEAVVTMDGVEVPRALVGVAHPVNPGSHVLAVKAPGHRADPVNVEVREASTAKATLVLVAVAGAAPAPVTAEPPPVAPSGTSGLRTAGWISLGVGAVGVGVGTAFMLVNRGKRSDAEGLCPGAVCAASNRDAIRELDASAGDAATLSWVGYGVGVAGLAAGATLLLLGRGSAEPASPRAARVTPWVGLGSAGVGGVF